MDSRMDHERCRVEQMIWTRLWKDVTMVINEEKVLRLDECKVNTLKTLTINVCQRISCCRSAYVRMD